MRANVAFISGIGAGAGLMLLLDPGRGARRRSLVRDQMIHAVHQTQDAAGTAVRDLRHRASGAAARLRGLARRSRVNDSVLIERVRAKMGRFVSHPRAIAVSAHDGVVRLEGPVLMHERKRLLRAIDSVRGVDHVDDRLEVHKEPGGIPSLQGGAPPPGEPWELSQRNWTPAARCLVGMAGGTITTYGVKRQDAIGAALAALGVGMAVRAATNLESARWLGIGAGRRAVDVEKAIDIHAPLAHVFDFWSHWEDFPRFMAHVAAVRPTRLPGQSHWTVTGPAGTPLEFDAMLTEFVPNRVIAWKTTPGSLVQHAGLVRFDPAGPATTRVTIRMSYNPPGGALGHAAASVLGADLKQLLDQDLVRMKTYVETGRPPHDAAASSASIRVE